MIWTNAMANITRMANNLAFWHRAIGENIRDAVRAVFPAILDFAVPISVKAAYPKPATIRITSLVNLIPKSLCNISLILSTERKQATGGTTETTRRRSPIRCRKHNAAMLACEGLVLAFGHNAISKDSHTFRRTGLVNARQVASNQIFLTTNGTAVDYSPFHFAGGRCPI